VGYDSSRFGVRFFDVRFFDVRFSSFVNRRSPAIRMASPWLFFYPLYELLLISWCFPLSRVRMSRRCFLTALRMRGTMWTVWWPSGQPIDVSSVSGRLAGQLTGLPMMRLWTDCQSCSHPHCYSHRLRCCTPQARWCSKYGPCARPELGHSYGWFSRLHEHSGRFSCRRVLPCLLDNPSGNPLWVSFLGRLGDGMDHRSGCPCMSCTGDILL